MNEEKTGKRKSAHTANRGQRMEESFDDGGGERDVRRQKAEQGLFVGWLLNVPATCECISGTDLLRQFYVLPH